MEKKQISKGFHKIKTLPENIKEYLKYKENQNTAAKKANIWLYSILNCNFCGGTAIGKHYATLILDITYQGGEVSISEEGSIKLYGEDINDKKQFTKVFNEYFEIV